MCHQVDRCASVGISAGRPARIPWLEGTSPDAVPRFICDVMTEGLARQLRLCGIDARSAPGAAGRQRYHAYMELVDSATREDRIVLTADTIFLRARWAAQSMHVNHGQPQPGGKSLHGEGMTEDSHWQWPCQLLESHCFLLATGTQTRLTG